MTCKHVVSGTINRMVLWRDKSTCCVLCCAFRGLGSVVSSVDSLPAGICVCGFCLGFGVGLAEIAFGGDPGLWGYVGMSGLDIV